MLIHLNNLKAKQIVELLQADGLRVHFGQCAEDDFILRYFAGRRNGFYVDVGAYHPTRHSNTHLLYEYYGWSGVNVDADNRAIEAFKKSRPKDASLVSAMSDRIETVELVRFEEGAVNTAVPNIAEHQKKNFAVLDKQTLETKTLKSLLEEHVGPSKRIDYMNVDVEGFDERVLRGNDWDVYRPGLITVEMHNFDMADPFSNQTFRILTERDYKMIGYHTMTGMFKDVRANA